MKVRDLLKMDIDIDVYDDYDERLCIAFVSDSTNEKLTEKGKERFSVALNLEVELHEDCAVVKCENGKEASNAARLFNGLAGYCSIENGKEWFVEW